MLPARFSAALNRPGSVSGRSCIIRARRSLSNSSDTRARARCKSRKSGLPGAEKSVDQLVEIRSSIFKAEFRGNRPDFVAQPAHSFSPAAPDQHVEAFLELEAGRCPGKPAAASARRAHVFQLGPRR